MTIFWNKLNSALNTGQDPRPRLLLSVVTDLMMITLFHSDTSGRKRIEPRAHIPMNYVLWNGKDAVLRGDFVPQLDAIYLGADPDNKAWFWLGPDNVNFIRCESLAQFGLIYKPDPARGYHAAA